MTEREVWALHDARRLGVMATVRELQAVKRLRWWRRPGPVFALCLWAALPWPFVVILAVALLRS